MLSLCGAGIIDIKYSGGGSRTSYYNQHFIFTLSDVKAEMDK